jgi:aspartate carbamoyltransferase catalytic subunit
MPTTTESISNPASTDAGIFFERMTPASHHLLGLDGMPREKLRALLDDAKQQHLRMERGELPSDELRQFTVCNAFFEDSTRTRISFEIAEKRLGAIAVSFAPDGSSLSKGESLLDTLRVIESMRVDLMVVRHHSPGMPHFLAKHLCASVINAGDGAHEHPTQGLLDLLTLDEAWHGRFEGRRIAIIGDIAHSRVARSACFGLRTLGTDVVVAGPPTLIPRDVEVLGCRRASSAEEALEGADAVMALRIQHERLEQALIATPGEYAREWGIDARRAALLHPDAIVMHPGPVNRDVELASEVMDHPRARVFRQVDHGVAVRCAVLRHCVAARREVA